MDEYYSVIRQLPPWLSQPLAVLPSWQAAAVQEIRLRLGNGIYFTVNGSPKKAVQYCSAFTELEQLQITQEMLWNILVVLCDHSLHTYEEQLQHGFFTLHGGHRVGVGGRYVYSNGKYTLQCVYSLNLRIARSHKITLPPQLSSLLQKPFGGLALIGPPLSGKTTVLRNIALELCRYGRVCTVIDERDELFACKNNTNELESLDLISGIDKAQGTQIALRTLAPQVILLDELGEMSEVAALRQAMFSGVDFIVTLHAATFTEAEKKPQFHSLRQDGFLRAACLLAGRSAPGVITEMRCW